MRILVFCPATLGAEPARSREQDVYRTVFEAYLPLLRDLGETIVVRDPLAEVDALHREAQAGGESCLLLCFTAPDQIPRGLTCPAVSVLLGPFDTVGDVSRPGETARDWRAALAPHAAVLALSPAAQAVVRTVMGETVPIHRLSTPVFERFAAGAPERSEPLRESRCVAGQSPIFDSWDYEFEPEAVRCRTPLERYCTRAWTGAREELRFDWDHESTAHLGGFYEPEGWGSWSRIKDPWVLLPFALSGSVKLTICAAGYGRNASRTIAVEIGGVRRELALAGGFEEPCLSFDLPQPAHLIQLRGLDTDAIPGVTDHRSMGIGLRWIALEGSGPLAPAPAVAPAIQEQRVEGVVYTSLDGDFTDADDPIKVWREIVKAFCFAFRDTPDAVLVLHAARIRPWFFAELHTLLHKAGRISGRILVLRGELDERRRRELIDASTYYLCAARYEALCLPFKEALSRGVPALAPEHLSRAEFPEADAALRMRYVAESPGWPVPDWQGARKATRHRADFESVVSCFRASYRVAKDDPSAYARMCRSSRESQARSSAEALVRKQLEGLLSHGLATR